MSELRIITNNHTRPLLSWWDLDEVQQTFVKDEHSWLWDNDVPTWDEEYFILYKGWIHTLSDFMRIDEKSAGCPFRKWDGYSGDSYFSGTLIKFVRDEWDDEITDEVVMGWYYQ